MIYKCDSCNSKLIPCYNIYTFNGTTMNSIYWKCPNQHQCGYSEIVHYLCCIRRVTYFTDKERVELLKEIK